MQSTGVQRLFARAEAGSPIVLDGGVRGALRRAGMDPDSALGTANVLTGNTHLLSVIHQQFCAAGVHVLRTATADTTPQALQRTGYGYRAAKLTSLAVDLAVEAAHSADRVVCVAGVLPSMEGTDARLRGEQAAHAQRLAAAGCDLLFVEAAGSLREAVSATAAAAQCDLPLIVSLRVNETGTLRDGEHLQVVCDALASVGARGFIAVASDPAGELRATGELAAGGRPWGVSYAGPVRLSAAEYALRAAQLVAEGATLLSGEDLVTPEHVRVLFEQVPSARWELRRLSAFPPPMVGSALSNLPPRI